MDNSNYIIVDGKKITENQIPHFYPLSIVKYQDSYDQLIRFVVETVYGISKKEKKYPVYVNLLASKSLKIKYLAIILEISKSHKIEEINIDYFPKQFESIIKVKIIEHQNKIDFIDKSEKVATLTKYIANLVFNILGWFIRKKGKQNVDAVVRAWVDVDERLHKKEFYNSMVFIYPFGINFKRSLKFIKKVFKNHSNVRLTGINYSIVDTFKVLFSKNQIHAIVNFEYNGMLKHSKKLLKYKTIYTSDEFQVAAPILYNNKGNTYVLNRAHGMGCYNLEINYDKFYVFNKVQQNFYCVNNHKTEFNTYNSEAEADQILNSPNLVYIDQGDLTKFNYHYETQLQNNLISVLKDINTNSSKTVFIKYHPNRTEKEKKDFSLNHNLQPINKINEGENYLFINLYSTSYFDFKQYGPFVFINDDVFSANYFFGNSIKSIHVNELKNTLLSNDN